MNGEKTTFKTRKLTVGSLFAGIGGFDLGFEQAGFKTAWQVEIDADCRAMLAQHFPHAQRHDDVRSAGRHNLGAVDVITAGFPCQDVSSMGARAGLAGARTGLFWEVCRIVEEIRPQWLVLENVVGLLNSNAGRDFGTVIQAIAQRGYVGCWRVLDSRYFGVAQGRRRVFVVAGLGRQPPPLGCWLMPHQWRHYLARLARAKGYGKRMNGLPIVCLQKTPTALLASVQRLLSVTEADGVRWLSGPECLKLQGFPSDWMRGITANSGRPETQCVYPWHAGSPAI